MLNDSRSLVLYCSILRMTVGRLGSQYDNKIYSNRDFVFINLFYYHPLIIIHYIIYLRDIYTMSLLLLCLKRKSRENFTLYSSLLPFISTIFTLKLTTCCFTKYSKQSYSYCFRCCGDTFDICRIAGWAVRYGWLLCGGLIFIFLFY